MLDLDFDVHSKYYEAPLQMKAIGGVFVIDDFGRQRVRPHELLNRWIFPLERKVDYLTLHTGKKFALLFDQLVIFATNFPPEELMDPAQLRRVHYKMKINPPTEEEFKEIFQRICDSYGLEFSEEIMAYLFNSFYHQAQSSLCRFSSQIYCRTCDRGMQLSRHGAANFPTVAGRLARKHGDLAQLAGPQSDPRWPKPLALDHPSERCAV